MRGRRRNGAGKEGEVRQGQVIEKESGGREKSSFSREIASQISRENYPIVSGPTLPLCQPRISSPGLHNRLFVSPFYPCRSSAAQRGQLSVRLFHPLVEMVEGGREEKVAFGYIVNFSSSFYLLVLSLSISLSFSGCGRFLLEHLFAVSSVTL